jgi:hypothetical protein
MMLAGSYISWEARTRKEADYHGRLLEKQNAPQENDTQR